MHDDYNGKIVAPNASLDGDDETDKKREADERKRHIQRLDFVVGRLNPTNSERDFDGTHSMYPKISRSCRMTLKMTNI